MMIVRSIDSQIQSHVDFQKAIVLLGPRQVGKTTLIQKISSGLIEKTIYINGDDPATRLSFDDPSWSFISSYLGNYKVVVFDEAHRLQGIGLTAKMIIDSGKGIQLFISGSSSLDRAGKVNEPLPGRKWEFRLFPLSWMEISNSLGFPAAFQRLEEMLITGMYPEVITGRENSKEILQNLAGSFLYKDILESSGIRKPYILLRLLRALAWQIGSEVSYNQLAQTIGADKNTVISYIDLLEKSFVIFRLEPFARKLRNEINSTRKIYFYDNGMRNTLISNYASINDRNDMGALWENFLISERKKFLTYNGFYGRSYFWRTKNQSEIDYLEESDGRLSAFEIRWNNQKGVRFPKAFMETYHPEKSLVIDQTNFWDWLNPREDQAV